jgi:hypothetical protein
MNEAQVPTFSYSALLPECRSIRRFRLKYDLESSPSISCILESFELAKFPDFEAISYTWGRPFAEAQDESEIED